MMIKILSSHGLALKNVLELKNFSTAFYFFLILGESLGLFALII